MDFIKTVMLAVYRLPFWKLGFLLLSCTLLFFFINCKLQKKKWIKYALLIGAAFYAELIVCVTVFWREEPVGGQSFDLRPLISYVRYARGQEEMLRECLMNVVFFYPLGLLFGAALDGVKGKRKYALIFGGGLLLSGGIEFCQWKFHLGFAETDDVIHNALGTGLGLLAAAKGGGISEKLLPFRVQRG
jgi:glycopeptide antibiotics resistance protein